MGLVLDAYPLIALLRAERAADEVLALATRGRASMPAVNLGEALDVLVRVAGVPARDAEVALEAAIESFLDVIPVTAGHARQAALLRARHYRRRTSELSLADCVLLATAGEDDEIATSDPALARAARAERLAVVALPDSRGRRP